FTPNHSIFAKNNCSMGVQVSFDSALNQKIFAALEIALYGGIAADIRIDSHNLSPFSHNGNWSIRELGN
ncbi:MAG: hypothetical protein WBG24_18365, partial [Syntrophobacteria bacterium]